MEYTDEYLITNDSTSLFISVKPDTDINDSFIAFCNDTQQTIEINGQHWLFERLN